MMIQTFTPRDATACCRLIRACIKLDESIPEAIRGKIISGETPETILERSRLFYVVVYTSECGDILGIAGLDMNEIRILCVSPEHQRRGIGRALLDHLISMVPDFVFPDVFVYASTEGIPFYKAAGFIEKGPMVFTFEDAQLQTVFMSLPIR